MKWLRYKSKAHALVEVMMAACIISFCATLSTFIYTGVQKSTRPFMKLKAAEAAAVIMKKTIEERSVTETESLEKGFVIKKTVTQAETQAGCYTIRLLVFDENKTKIYELESSLCGAVNAW